jgi:methionyl-tRNA formyltransferase
MRLVFLGTPEFAVPTLERILQGGHEVLAVVTQPDRPSGRGARLAAPPVKQLALRHGLPVYQPERIRRPEAVARLAALQAEVMVVVGYGQIIPQPVIDLPPRGILNVHASLLPRYRGAAPVQWAIVNGETRTGVTIMRIDAGLDTGDILLQAETAIGPEETAIELAARLSGMGAALLVEALDRLARGELPARPQDPAEATYAPLLKKEDGRLDWSQSAAALHNRVRGMQPWPGAHTTFRRRNLHIWRSRLPAAPAPSLAPGRLRFSRALYAGCGGHSALELLQVQLEGRKRIDAAEFANGQHLTENDFLGDPLS